MAITVLAALWPAQGIARHRKQSRFDRCGERLFVVVRVELALSS